MVGRAASDPILALLPAERPWAFDQLPPDEQEWRARVFLVVYIQSGGHAAFSWSNALHAYGDDEEHIKTWVLANADLESLVDGLQSLQQPEPTTRTSVRERGDDAASSTVSDRILELLPLVQPLTFTLLSAKDRAWRGRAFLMAVGGGLAEGQAWWWALQEDENGEEVRAQAAEVSDDAIAAALAARFLPLN